MFEIFLFRPAISALALKAVSICQSLFDIAQTWLFKELQSFTFHVKCMPNVKLTASDVKAASHVENPAKDEINRLELVTTI